MQQPASANAAAIATAEIDGQIQTRCNLVTSVSSASMVTIVSSVIAESFKTLTVMEQPGSEREDATQPGQKQIEPTSTAESASSVGHLESLTVDCCKNLKNTNDRIPLTSKEICMKSKILR